MIMKKILIVTLLIITGCIQIGVAQFASVDEEFGDWEQNQTWQGGTPPGTTNPNADITINGFVIRNGSLTTDDILTISENDTLEIQGDLSMGNNGELFVEDGAVLVIFGNFTAGNKIDIASGGTIVVEGQFDKQGASGQGSYTGTGNLYAGSYTGKANDWFTATGATANQRSVSDLCTDGQCALEDLVTNNGTLPIDLKSFSASKSGKQIALDWVTAKEENFSHFEIERSIDQNNWNQIGLVQGMGESMSDVNYDFTDRNAPFGMIYYRLKAVDIDATFEYFQVIKIENGFEGKLAVSPNPVKDAASLKIQVPSEFREDLAYVGLFDLSGVMVQEFRNFNTDGSLQINQKLKSGMYILKVNHNGLQENIRVIVQ
jgi:hypothetical protein